MAKAILPDGKEWQVYVTRDLDDNWAVALKSGDRVEGYPVAREFAPILVKIRAKSQWSAVEGALTGLKQKGTIKDYVNDPKPADTAAGGGGTEAPEEA